MFACLNTPVVVRTGDSLLEASEQRPGRPTTTLKPTQRHYRISNDGPTNVSVGLLEEAQSVKSTVWQSEEVIHGDHGPAVGALGAPQKNLKSSLLPSHPRHHHQRYFHHHCFDST